jgi:hypothetical protein
MTSNELKLIIALSLHSTLNFQPREENQSPQMYLAIFKELKIQVHLATIFVPHGKFSNRLVFYFIN